jgi:hypothetical protein
LGRSWKKEGRAMAIAILGPFNKIINATAREIIDSEIPSRTAGIFKTLIDSTIEVIDDTLKKVQDLTEEQEEEDENP